MLMPPGAGSILKATAQSPFLLQNKRGTCRKRKESAMVIIDGAFLMGVAAVLTSLASLWRVVREDRQKAALNTKEQTKTAKVAFHACSVNQIAD
jgi:hypothetical protein